MNLQTHSPMNEATQEVIRLLTHPKLNLGDGPSDVAFLADPQLLRERVQDLLAAPSTPWPEPQDAERLRACLPEADWIAVAHEFHARIEMASHFFDDDAQAHHQGPVK